MKIVSLFTGAGGLDLGFTQAGFEVIWANDILKHACETYKENKKYFNAEKYTDPNEKYNGKHRIFCGKIEDIKSFRKAVGPHDIDLVIGGFPCQDFSLLRGCETKGRCGIKVKRGRLYCHFVRALKELKPKMFLAENVKGLKTANQGKAYETIIDDFENLKDRWGEIKEYGEFNNSKTSNNNFEGYHMLFRDVIDFSKLGVPQKRERLIIIGLRKDIYKNLQANRCFSILNFEDKLKKKFTKEGYDNYSKYPMTPMEILHGKILTDLQNEYESIMKPYGETVTEIESKKQKRYMKEVWPNYSFNVWKDYFEENSMDMPSNHIENCKKENNNLEQVKSDIEKIHSSLLDELGYKISVDELRNTGNENSEILQEQDPIKVRMKHIPPGENHEFVKGTDYHVTGLMSNIYKRIHPLRPSPTIIACGGGGTWGYHFSINRQRLNLRERARLQTFPDDFIFEGTAGRVRTQIGNAVPPLAGKKIAGELKNILSRIK